MISGVRHIVLKIKFHVKLKSLNHTNNLTPAAVFCDDFYYVIFSKS